MMANTMKLTGSPKKFPTFIARSLRAKREKSPKLSSRAAKWPTISIAALAMWPTAEPSTRGLSCSDRLDVPVCANIHIASANITM